MKKLVVLAAALLTLTACTSKKAEQPLAPEQMASSPMHHDYKGEKAAMKAERAEKKEEASAEAK